VKEKLIVKAIWEQNRIKNTFVFYFLLRSNKIILTVMKYILLRLTTNIKGG